MTTPEALAEVRRIVSEWWQTIDISEELRDELDDYPPKLIEALGIHLGEGREQADEEIRRLRDRCEERAAEIIRLRQDAERPKCAYCDFGEKDQVTLDLLKWHIEKECAAHPIYQLMRERDAQAAAHGEDVRKIQVRLLKLEALLPLVAKMLDEDYGDGWRKPDYFEPKLYHYEEELFAAMRALLAETDGR